MTALSDRKNQILSSVINMYIKNGEPVGSKSLITATGMNCSSATVRNELNELDSLGYLLQPHTSAGRIPSEKGYRYYVDNLMVTRELDEFTKMAIDSRLLTAAGDPEKLINTARELLADITKCACVTTTPVGVMNLIRKIEIVPVSVHSAMMVLLTSNGILKSRLCRIDNGIDAQILDKFYNIVKTYFVGQPASEISQASIQTVAASVNEDYFAMLPLLAAVSDLAGSITDSRFVLGGSSNLITVRDYGENVISLLEFLKRKEPIVEVINSSKEPFSIKIGSENMYRQLFDSSVIISKYKVRDDDSGTLSIIGPTRMDYETVIPGVRYLSDMVGKMITSALDE